MNHPPMSAPVPRGYEGEGQRQMREEEVSNLRPYRWKSPEGRKETRVAGEQTTGTRGMGRSHVPRHLVRREGIAFSTWVRPFHSRTCWPRRWRHPSPLFTCSLYTVRPSTLRLSRWAPPPKTYHHVKDTKIKQKQRSRWWPNTHTGKVTWPSKDRKGPRRLPPPLYRQNVRQFAYITKPLRGRQTRVSDSGLALDARHPTSRRHKWPQGATGEQVPEGWCSTFCRLSEAGEQEGAEEQMSAELSGRGPQRQRGNSMQRGEQGPRS